MERRERRVLSCQQIDRFLCDGVLVVEGILDANEIERAKNGLHRTLNSHGVDHARLEATGHNLRALSSTNGSGGVLDLFYPEWKMDIASNPKLFEATCQLWEAAFCQNGEKAAELPGADTFKWHPYGQFDCNKGYMYIDRICYRIPTELSLQLGARMQETAKKKKVKPIQRSLTPHLDCCPDDFFGSSSKWRPIQCFVSLTDNTEPNTGGFEAASGFHREFDTWSQRRLPTTMTRKVDGVATRVSFPAPCLGEYTHVRPTEDADVMARIRHVPVRAGCAVFWDNRIPHANAYRHNGQIPRAVVYCSFLPDIPLNREYVEKQLANLRAGRKPTDQWINAPSEDDDPGPSDAFLSSSSLAPLARKLLGMDSW